MAKAEIKVKVTTVGGYLANDLAQLVEQMREAQKEYFRTHSNNALQKAKGLEKEVDKVVSSLLYPDKDRKVDIPGQLDMFGGAV